MSKVTRDELMRVLGTCIANAPGNNKQQLAEALAGYARSYSHAYRNLSRGDSLIAAMLEVLEEATDARIERDAAGVPI